MINGSKPRKGAVRRYNTAPSQPRLRRPEAACSRSNHGSLPRGLEGLHASLLRAGARTAGILARKMMPLTVDDQDPTPPATASPSGFSAKDFTLTPGRRHSAQPTGVGRNLPPPSLKRLVATKQAVAPPSPASTDPSFTPIGSDQTGDGMWCQYSGEGGEGQEDAMTLPPGKSRKKGQPTQTVNQENQVRTKKRASKQVFPYDSLSAAFEASCRVSHKAADQVDNFEAEMPDDAPPLQAAAPANPVQKRGSRLEVNGSDVDTPFLWRLSDMSLRFPEPPTRPPPEPPASPVKAIATSKWGKSIASAIPSMQFVVPSRWKKTALVNNKNRPRKSTSIWVARSKATTSLSESFHMKRALRTTNPSSVEKEAPALASPPPPPLNQAPLPPPTPPSPPLERAPAPPRVFAPKQPLNISDKINTETEAAVYPSAKEAGVSHLNHQATASTSAAPPSPATVADAVSPTPLRPWVWSGHAPNRRHHSLRVLSHVVKEEQHSQSEGQPLGIPPTVRRSKSFKHRSMNNVGPVGWLKDLSYSFRPSIPVNEGECLCE